MQYYYDNTADWAICHALDNNYGWSCRGHKKLHKQYQIINLDEHRQGYEQFNYLLLNLNSWKDTHTVLLSYMMNNSNQYVVMGT